MWFPAATALHDSHSQHGSPPPDTFRQFTVLARRRAAVVFPQPLGPEKRYAWPNLPAMYDSRSTSTAESCPTISRNIFGLYFL
jgi:hypothetical protein